MKIRSGFVSNSSSSSFIIERKNLTKKQISKIKNHIDEHNKMDPLDQYNHCDGWSIYENLPEGYSEYDDKVKRKYRQGHIEGYCNMDNFSMYSFLEEIGVLDNDINWTY